MSRIACNEWLLTLVNLASRHVPVDPTCPLCGKHPETTTHALLGCPSFRQIRRAFPGLSGGIKVDSLKLIDALLFYKRLLHHSEFLELVVLLWKIWSSRNAFTHDRPCLNDELIVP
ncbi:hypothetical protein ACOSQ3_018703 [Xanthoceras sorbifolium]